jgi:hypothetical protein
MDQSEARLTIQALPKTGDEVIRAIDTAIAYINESSIFFIFYV